MDNARFCIIPRGNTPWTRRFFDAVVRGCIPAVLSDPVPLAVGVLMHRHALARSEAWRRLQRLAQEQGLSVSAQAERLLGAVEELARSG